MMVKADDAMLFCDLATRTTTITATYSRPGDDLIHKPTSIPKGQSYSLQNNKTHTHCTDQCLVAGSKMSHHVDS